MIAAGPGPVLPQVQGEPRVPNIPSRRILRSRAWRSVSAS